jgi:hypothetical protein
MASPWTIGAALVGVGILGYWLLGPKNSSTQDKPQAMPKLNQSMRGSTVYVSFGSNKINAQVPWTKNFHAIRQQSSGKGGGKLGGSGGFGSAKGGGSAAQSYIYKWDMIFTYGIMDQPCYIRRGWIGGDLIDKANLNTLTGGDTDAAIAAYGSTTAMPDEQIAKLTYGSAHVARGYGTGDVNLTSWTYFQTQEGLACAFPYNAWVGFEQLNLGQTPSVPQLSLEFVPVPVDGGFASNVAFGATFNSTTSGHSTLNEASSNGFMEANGKHYSVMQDDQSSLYMVCVEDGSFQKLSNAQFQTDVGSASYGIGTGGIPCPGTAYYWIISASPNAAHFDIKAARYKIGTSGEWTVDTVVNASTATTNYALFDWSSSLVDGTNVIALGIVSSGARHLAYVTLPLTGSTLGTWESLWTDVSPSNNFFDYVGNNVVGREGVAMIAKVGSSYVAYAYVNQGYYDYISTHTGTNAQWPNITSPGLYAVAAGSVTLAIPAMDDAMTTLAGGVSANYLDDYCNPTYFQSGGDTFLAFTRGYTDHNGAGEVVARSRIFQWDGATATETAAFQSAIFNPVIDMGESSGNALNEIPQAIQIYMGNDGTLRYQYMAGVLTGYRYVWGTFADAGNTNMDVTPAYIVYRILTSPVFGFATSALFGFTITEARIDQTAYLLAKQWCVDQGLYVSVGYINADNVLTVLEELLSLFNGFLTDLGGTVYFNFVSGTETPVRTIDNNHLVADAGKPPVKITKAATDDGYNIIQFQYLDRLLEYNPNMVEESDEVDVDFTGPRVKQYQPRFTMAGSVAQMLARRALWQNLYAKDRYEFKLGWKDADLHQGALVTLVDSFDPTLSQGVRARLVKWDEQDRGKFTVTAVREFPYIMAASASYTQTSSVNGGFGSIVQSPTPMLEFRAYELPKEFQTKPQIYFGYNQGFYNMGAQLYLSHDGANYVLTSDVQPYIISGLFPNTLEQRPQGYCEEFVDFYLFPNSQTASPNFIFGDAIDDVSQALRAAGAGVFIVGSEAVSVENLTLIGSNHYRARRMYRGWGGTPISAHSAAALWHYHAAGIFAHDINARRHRHHALLQDTRLQFRWRRLRSFQHRRAYIHDQRRLLASACAGAFPLLRAVGTGLVVKYRDHRAVHRHRLWRL